MDDQGHYKGSFAVITDITDLKRTEQAMIAREKELRIKTKNLEDVNTALRILLEKRDKDRAAVEDRILFNVNDLIMPHVEKLKTGGLDASQKAQLGIMESHLSQIIAPFSHNLSLKHMNLSHTEIEVANLIKQGKTTRAIAETFQISSKTIEDHRKNIRKKLGITNMKTNLRTHLLAMQ